MSSNQNNTSNFDEFHVRKESSNHSHLHGDEHDYDEDDDHDPEEFLKHSDHCIFTDRPVTFIDWSSKRLAYDPRSNVLAQCRIHNKHKGQIKLLLYEIDFLCTYAKKGCTVVYAGAAGGWHIPTLDAMFFPLQLKWKLYDPSAFHPDVYRWKRQNSDRVQVLNTIFTGIDAMKLQATKDVLFISDIRTKSEDDDRAPGDPSVMENQQVQMDWVQKMQPLACSLSL